MKTIFFRIFALVFLCLGAAHVAAQEQWLQLTSPTTSNLISVAFPDSAIGYTVGDAGNIFKTTDAAGSWTAQVSGVTQNLASVRFTSVSNGVAVGAQGVILRTTNGGASWVLRASGTTRNLNALEFADASTGYAVGDTGLILKTTDGGATWASQTTGTTQNLYAVHMLNPALGYVTGQSLTNSSGGIAVFLKTSNGTDWTSLNGPAFATAYSVWALDTNRLFAANFADNISRSTDGGTSWQGGTLSNMNSGYGTVYFVSPTVGYGLFSGSNIVKTTDAGASWFNQSTPSGADFRGIAFTSLNNGYMVCEGGKIFKHVYTPPATPIASLPANNLTDAPLNLNLSWGVVSFTSTYRVQVATDSLFTSPVLDDSTLLSATAFLESLSTSTKYYWRVSAKNPGGTSGWSTVRAFTTVPPPPALPPVPGAPVSGATNVAVSGALTWASAAGATAYRVQLSTNSGFTAIVKDTIQAGLSKTVGPLSNSTTYFWRVDAENAGGTSAFSSASSFTTVAVPATPVPSTPATGAVNIILSPTLSWAASANALTYRVQLSTDSTFATTTVNDSTVTGTSRTVGSLANNVKYFWRVNAKHGGTSAFSPVMSFTTQPVAPGITTLSAPAQAATNISLNPTLSWTTVSAAAAYRLQVSADSNFVSPAVDDTTPTGTSLVVGPLASGTVYYWRVSTRNGGGSSAFTTKRSFTTVPAIPAVPTLASPGNGATGVTAATSLVWGSVGGATNYSVQISRDSTFATTLLTDTTLTTASRAVSGLMYNMTYYWRASARNIGGASVYSTFSRFTTAALALPVTTGPAATGVAISPTLTWNAVTGATTYHVQLASDSLFASLIVNDSTGTAASRGVGPLTAGTSYFWRVRARSLSGVNELSIGDWSGTQKFTVLALPAVPTLSSPGVDSTSVPTSPSLVWLSVAGAATYRVQLATDSLFSAPIVNDSTLTATTRAVGPLGNSTRYFWRVNAKNGSGTSAYSGVRKFTTVAIPAPVLAAPAAAATGQSVVLTLSWNAAAGAVAYTVQVSTDSLFATLAVNELVTTLTRQVGPLSSNAGYYWRVRAENGTSLSAFSDVRKFTTLAVPAVPALTSPATDTVGVPVSATLAWTASAGAATYRVQLSADSTFATTTVNDSTLTATTRDVSGLLESKTYYWRVNAKNGGGTSAYSPTRRFVTFTPVSILPVAYGLRSLSLAGGNVLQFDLPKAGMVRIRLLGLAGNVSATLLEGMRPAGSYSLKLPDSKGLYLIDFRAGNFRKVVRIVQ